MLLTGYWRQERQNERGVQERAWMTTKMKIKQKKGRVGEDHSKEDAELCLGHRCVVPEGTPDWEGREVTLCRRAALHGSCVRVFTSLNL